MYVYVYIYIYIYISYLKTSTGDRRSRPPAGEGRRPRGRHALSGLPPAPPGSPRYKYYYYNYNYYYYYLNYYYYTKILPTKIH